MSWPLANFPMYQISWKQNSNLYLKV